MKKFYVYAIVTLCLGLLFLQGLSGVGNAKEYRVIEIVGTSPISWEDAAKIAVETATKTLEDISVAVVEEMDMTVEEGKVTHFRVRMNIYLPKK